MLSYVYVRLIFIARMPLADNVCVFSFIIMTLEVTFSITRTVFRSNQEGCFTFCFYAPSWWVRDIPFDSKRGRCNFLTAYLRVSFCSIGMGSYVQPPAGIGLLDCCKFLIVNLVGSSTEWWGAGSWQGIPFRSLGSSYRILNTTVELEGYRRCVDQRMRGRGQSTLL